MNFKEIEELKELGFTGFKSIGELFINTSMIPNVRGVYCIFNLSDKNSVFLTEGCGGYFKKKNPNVSLSELNRKMVEDSRIVYIGKAGGEGKNATIRSRLKQYL